MPPAARSTAAAGFAIARCARGEQLLETLHLNPLSGVARILRGDLLLLLDFLRLSAPHKRKERMLHGGTCRQSFGEPGKIRRSLPRSRCMHDVIAEKAH